MANFSLRDVLRLLGGGARPPHPPDESDDHLLDQFVAHRAEESFRALVRRHGPAVLGICRRVLRDEQLAEDAFQATFLVLTRKAASVRRRQALAGWLHRVAFHVALRARRQAETLQPTGETLEQSAGDEADAAGMEAELHSLLSEEVRGLPEKYRSPVVLCYWEGKTYEEAAATLGCPAGTVSGRLARARDLLRKRLLRRGVTAPSVAIALSAGRPASAGVPERLIETTTRAAGSLAGVSGRAVALMEGVLRNMTATRLKIIALILLTLGGIGAAAGVLLTEAAPDKGTPAPRVGGTDPAAPDRRAEPLPPAPDRPLLTFKPHDSQLSAVCFSPDGAYVLSAGSNDENGQYNSRVRLWHIKDNKAVAGPPPLTRAIRGLALSGDGKYLAVCTSGVWQGAPNRPFRVERGDLQLHDVTTGKLAANLKGASLSYDCVAFSPDGKLLAAGSDDKDPRGMDVKPGGVVRLFQVPGGKEVKALQGHRGMVRSIAFSPDGKRLVSATYLPRLTPREPEADGEVKVWDVARGKELVTLAGHKGSVWAVAFSPDGKLVASGGRDGVIHLWDADKGQEVAQLKGHAATVVSLAFSPDGRTLASGAGNPSADRTPGELKLWDVAGRKEWGTLKGHGETVMSVAFDWEGKKLVSGDRRGTVMVWDLTGKEKP